ncbi:MAG: nitrate/nitrite transporter NrtS [Cytophagales bacterium]|nr:nitrate/nitrite transporter NrtS [Cytophagales bacterium]
MTITMKNFLLNLFNPLLAVPALKVALVVGSILFIINHGVSLYHGQMTTQRWVSALLSYLVPYLVSIHGRSASNQKG